MRRAVRDCFGHRDGCIVEQWEVRYTVRGLGQRKCELGRAPTRMDERICHFGNSRRALLIRFLWQSSDPTFQVIARLKSPDS